MNAATEADLSAPSRLRARRTTSATRSARRMSGAASMADVLPPGLRPRVVGSLLPRWLTLQECALRRAWRKGRNAPPRPGVCRWTSMPPAGIAPREMTSEPPRSLAPAGAARPEPDSGAAPPAAWVHALACATRAFHPRGTDWLLRKIYPPGHRRAVRTVLGYDD